MAEILRKGADVTDEALCLSCGSLLRYRYSEARQLPAGMHVVECPGCKHDVRITLDIRRARGAARVPYV